MNRVISESYYKGTILQKKQLQENEHENSFVKFNAKIIGSHSAVSPFITL